MARKRSEEKEIRWREVVERQEQSGLSVRGFCAREGISEASFYAWRKTLRERSDSRKQSPKKASGCEETVDKSRLFVPLQLLDTAATLEIIHPLGYRIQVHGDVKPSALRQVIEVLDERGAR